MSSDTPTILKKILARKLEEIAERSAVVSIPQLIEKLQVCITATWFCRRDCRQNCRWPIRLLLPRLKKPRPAKG